MDFFENFEHFGLSGGQFMAQPIGMLAGGTEGFDGQGFGTIRSDDPYPRGIRGGGGEAFDDGIGGLVLLAVDDSHASGLDWFAGPLFAVEDQSDQPSPRIMEFPHGETEGFAGLGGLMAVQDAQLIPSMNHAVAVDEQISMLHRCGHVCEGGGPR